MASQLQDFLNYIWKQLKSEIRDWTHFFELCEVVRKIKMLFFLPAFEKKSRTFYLLFDKNVFADAFRTLVKTWHLEILPVNTKAISKLFYSDRNMLFL